jgi:Protein of unknown function (DUF433)
MNHIEQITVDPAVCHGSPCVRGLRYPVEMLLGLLSSGTTIEEVLADYADLEREDSVGVCRPGDSYPLDGSQRPASLRLAWAWPFAV